LAEHVLHEHARAQDHPLIVACFEPLIDRGVTPAHQRFRIRLCQRAVAADPHQIFGAGVTCCIEYVGLLFDHIGTVHGDNEHALNAGERLFQRRTVVQFRDRGFGIRAQYFARFVRIANNTNRILSERPKLFHRRASGIARCSDYCNRDRRLLPTGSRRGTPLRFHLQSSSAWRRTAG
jgi:hypothetical protein